MLLVDANILVRCALGRANSRVAALTTRGVTVATTEHNVAECLDVLVRKMGMTEHDATTATANVLRPFAVMGSDDYDWRRDDALSRLRQGGKSDWPILAAGLAFDADLWSDDVDLFGTGVAVWTSANTQFYARDQGSSDG